MLSSLLGLVGSRERIVLAEDSAELRPDHPHVVRLEARPPNQEGTGHVTLRDLVRQALRMRPDRLVVGEVRGHEVSDLLAALSTGHEGGCGTVHANTAADVPARLEAWGRRRVWTGRRCTASSRRASPPWCTWYAARTGRAAWPKCASWNGAVTASWPPCPPCAGRPRGSSGSPAGNACGPCSEVDRGDGTAAVCGSALRGRGGLALCRGARRRTPAARRAERGRRGRTALGRDEAARGDTEVACARREAAGPGSAGVAVPGCGVGARRAG